MLPISADVRDEAAVKQALDKITSEFDLPTIIINNAAGNFISPTERLSYNAWKTVVDIVLNGTANVTLQAGKRLIDAGKGKTAGSLCFVVLPSARSMKLKHFECALAKLPFKQGASTEVQRALIFTNNISCVPHT